MEKFHTNSDRDIFEGRTTDIYFENTKTVLRKANKSNTRVVSEFTVSRFPQDWPFAVFSGLSEV
jgi:nicotinate phosphoribosyltransferase